MINFLDLFKLLKLNQEGTNNLNRTTTKKETEREKGGGAFQLKIYRGPCGFNRILPNFSKNYNQSSLIILKLYKSISRRSTLKLFL
jgi:hypothetical protein